MASFCFCVIFVLLLLYLTVCFVPLRLIPHPIVAITDLRIHEMCVCVCMYVCMYIWMDGWMDG